MSAQNKIMQPVKEDKKKVNSTLNYLNLGRMLVCFYFYFILNLFFSF